MPQPAAPPAPSTSALRVQIAERALAAGTTFDRALHLYVRHWLLQRFRKKATAKTTFTMTGGNALAIHLGDEHRRLNLVELRVSGEHSLLHVYPLLPVVAISNDYDLDGLWLKSTFMSYPVDRGEAEARQFLLCFNLGSAETSFRLNVEESKTEPQTETMEIAAPLDLGEPVKMAVASPSAIFADSIERIVRRDALRVPMRCYLDAWMAAQIDPLDEVEQAIKGVFQRRGTPVPKGETPYTLSDEFAAGAHAQKQWALFVEREAPGAGVSVEDAVAGVREVSMVAFEALR